MSGIVDPEAPYPDGCGPDCKGCDPCVCGHPWSDHSVENGCHGRHSCGCNGFDALFKPRIFMPPGDTQGAK